MGEREQGWRAPDPPVGPAAIRAGVAAGVASSAGAMIGAFAGPVAALAIALLATVVLTLLAQRSVFGPVEATLAAMREGTLREHLERSRRHTWSEAIASSVLRQQDELRGRTNPIATRLGDLGNIADLVADLDFAIAESARAGEASRGFAVVANEVRELANETAKASGEISQKIKTIQADTRNAVAAIRQITEVVERINAIQTSIAGAVVEQAATADAIQRSVKDAAESGVHIRANMAGLTTAAGSTARGAEETRNAIEQFSKMTVELRGLAQSLSGVTANT